MEVASIVSSVPTIAADVKSYNTDEGTIYSSKSFGRGTYVVDGKYTKLDDARLGGIIGDINDKYLDFDNGDYYVDITTGKEVTDDIIGNLNDDVASAVRKNIKKDDDGRFLESDTTTLIEPDYIKGSDNKNTGIYGITGKWRQFTYNLDSDKTFTVGSYTKDSETIYTDEKGNYVDADAWGIGGGNLYCMGDGYVKKWINKNDDFEKIYKVDGGLTSFSVAYDGSVAAWNTDDEVYSLIYNKASSDESADTTQTTSQTTTSAAVGCGKNTDNTWSYNKAYGTKAIGWLKDGSTWYYLNSNGIMATGWVNDNGEWYYCNQSGAMLSNTTVDGYELGSTGAWSK